MGLGPTEILLNFESDLLLSTHKKISCLLIITLPGGGICSLSANVNFRFYLCFSYTIWTPLS